MRAIAILLQVIRRNWAFVTLLLFSSITILSLWPLTTLPDIPGSDKSHHVIAYAALMFPVALRKPRYWKIIGLLFVAYSGLIELIQPYVNRHGEWLDMAANTVGILSGWLIVELTVFFFPGATRGQR